jgi:hypothetical protein
MARIDALQRNEEQGRIVDALSASSPLLAEAAELLTLTSLPVVGLPFTGLAQDDPKGKAGVTTKGDEQLTLRTEGLALAEALSQQVSVIAQAAPVVAAAAPNIGVAAAA